MSVQFGRWKLDGRTNDQDYLKKVTAILAPYGPDATGFYFKGNVGIVYCAFHTTGESQGEVQPYVTSSGTVITWDGRLDNRAELIRLLGDASAFASADVTIVAAAYEKWGTNCFAKLIGDWALSIWDAKTHSLILAKDPIGTRHLYYSFDHRQIIWSTILDPLVLLAGKTFALCEEYIAGWFSFFPATHLTPYVGIHSVSPSSSVLLRHGKHEIFQYWDFDPGKKIRYRSDAEYEEHFRAVFSEAVRRRLRSHTPVLAELSGGLDSSSIVCMADAMIADGISETPRLDTVSYFDDFEPHWNERPYFTKVEEKRGRIGCHINAASDQSRTFEYESGRFLATPGSYVRPTEAAKQYAACLNTQGIRVVLSGIGGDEVTGGVPTPAPELEDLIAGAQFRTLAHQLKSWALNKRKPWFHLLFEAVRRFCPVKLVGVSKHKMPPAWLNPDFVRRNRRALHGYEARVNLFGPLPSFQENISTLDMLRRQLECDLLPSEPLCERRYPYLDRNLLEFLYAVPREQIVRPGHRRSLMRRALVGIVPEEILNRKRKAFVVRGPRAAVASQGATLLELNQHMLSSAFGITNAEEFRFALQKAHDGQAIPIVPLMRTLVVERWLTNLSSWHVLLDSGKLPTQSERQLASARSCSS